MKALRSFSSVILLAVAGVAFAHGDEKPAGKNVPVKKEQKAWGIAGDARKITRTIEMKMLDTMRFEPGVINVRTGETIRFVIKNAGKIQHELVIGTRAELAEHAALMVKFPGMEHDEPYMVHVGPGKVGTLTWTFNRPGEFEFGCLIAGHFEAGMLGKIRVAAK